MASATTNFFNIANEQKIDLAALLKSAANAAASCSSQSASSPPPTPSSLNSNGTPPPTNGSPPILNGTPSQLINPITQIALNTHSPFTPIRPVYAPSGYGRQILIYDSRSYPGHRREFAYKTRFTNQSGLTTVYYRCMACRALRHRLQRILPKEKLPAVPCIAVKNELLINDPDFPEASDHFCTPLTIEESNNRLKITFERGFKRARMKMAAEEPSNGPQMKKEATATATCEINESNPINIDQYLWTKQSESASCLLINEDENGNGQSSSSDTSKDEKKEGSEGMMQEGESSFGTHPANDTTLDDDENGSDSEMLVVDDLDSLSPRKRLDALLRLQEKRAEAEARDKSTSPDENLNIQSFTQKLITDPAINTAATNFLSQFAGLNQNGAAANGFNFSAAAGFNNLLFKGANGNGGNDSNTSSLMNIQALAAKLSRGSSSTELMRVLNKKDASQLQVPNGVYANGGAGYYCLGNTSAMSMGNGVGSGAMSPHMGEILNKYIKNNWDLPENAGNSRSAAELTCTLILASARSVPQASASMKQGLWARKDFMGEEVYGKTLAIIGLGRIGLEVASRMQAFGMKTIGFDPLVTNEDAAKRQIKWLPLEEIWPVADYITLHVPLIPQTKDLLNAATLAKCKKGVRIVNVARGGIVNEKDLVDSLNAGHAGGAAVDVYVEEPPTYRALIEHPKVVCTPHLGASTLEAQQRVAVEIAENIIALNNGTGLFGALNATALASVLDDNKAQYVKAASSLGQVLASLTPNTKNVTVKYPSAANGLQKALIAGTVVGLLNASGCAGLNLVNAEVNAIKEGITVKTELNNGAGSELILSSGQITITGYPSPAGTIISAINEAKVPVPIMAAGNLAISKNVGNGQKGQNVHAIIEDELKSKLSVDYRLLGGGRVALFDELDAEEVRELSKHFHIVQFGD